MSRIKFSASVQMAVDWVCEQLLYGEDTFYPRPTTVGMRWFDSIEASEVQVSHRVDSLTRDLSRQVDFYIKNTIVATVYLDGTRYTTYLCNTHTMWAVSDVIYQKDWTLGRPGHDVHHIHCQAPTWAETTNELE
ncbi:MAG: hypothetical protein WBP22_04525 [Candidatus Saccharimonas sp.]